VSFDHRGFGQSREVADGPGGAAFVDDLRRLLDHLGIDQVRLVAQSMGGWTALGFTLRYPQRVERLVMCDTHGGILSDEIQPAWAHVGRALSELPPGVHPAAGARMAREQPGLHFLYTQINDLNPPRELSAVAMMLRDVGSPAPEQVAALDVPVLFLHGDEDIVIPPRVCEIAATYFKQARFERVAAAGHSVYFERPAVFNALVDAFVRS
jgi:pimeloyl-ACP methyl ester carboxylesterase